MKLLTVIANYSVIGVITQLTGVMFFVLHIEEPYYSAHKYVARHLCSVLWILWMNL